MHAWNACDDPRAFDCVPGLCELRQSMCAFCTFFNHGFCTVVFLCQSARAGTAGGVFLTGVFAGTDASAFFAGGLAGDDAMAMAAGRFANIFRAGGSISEPLAESILIE